MRHDDIKREALDALSPAGAQLRPLRDVEIEYLLLAIQTLKGEMKEVARQLRISRSTIYRMLDERGHDASEIRRQAKGHCSQ